MGQVLRITVGKSDYTFRIIKPEPPSIASTEIEVVVEGRQLTLVREGRSWVSRETAGDGLEDVAEAIGKAIALRYRI